MRIPTAWFSILASFSLLNQAEAVACDQTTSYSYNGGCRPRVTSCGSAGTTIVSPSDFCRCHFPGPITFPGYSACPKITPNSSPHCETFGQGPFSSKCILKCDPGFKLTVSEKCVQEVLQGCPDTTMRVGVAPLGSESGCGCLDVSTVDGDGGSLCPTMKAGADGQTHGKSICVLDDAGDGVCKVECFAPYKQQGPRLCSLPSGP